MESPKHPTPPPPPGACMVEMHAEEKTVALHFHGVRFVSDMFPVEYRRRVDVAQRASICCNRHLAESYQEIYHSSDLNAAFMDGARKAATKILELVKQDKMTPEACVQTVLDMMATASTPKAST